MVLLLWISNILYATHYTKASGHLQTPCNKVNVALLLPLSGPKASLGNHLMQAAQQALFDHPLTANLILYPIDTHKKTSVTEEIRSLNPALIVGPVFSEETREIQSHTEGIPLFTLSNDPALLNGSVFVMGISPQEEANELINFSLKKGLRRFVALLPKNAYGHSLEKPLKQIIKGENGAKLKIIFYTTTEEPSPHSIQEWVKEINAFFPQAIFMPDGSPFTQNLLSTLKFNELHCHDVRLLGSSQWDSPHTFKDASLKGLWVTRNRSKRFRETLGASATPLDGIVYDTIAMMGEVHRDIKKNIFKWENFLHQKEFSGVHGQFILQPNGAVKRSWHIVEHMGQGARVIG